MYNTQLKTILYKYANDHGLGLPLTAEQCLNAMSTWLTVTLPDCIDVKTVTVTSVEDINVTLEGNGTPDNHYVFTFYLCKGEKGDTGVGLKFITVTEI